jgi:hypothetical protein
MVRCRTAEPSAAACSGLQERSLDSRSPSALESKIQALSLGPTIAFGATVSLLKIRRTMDGAVVFMVSGRLDVENVGELCQLIDGEPPGAVVVLDLTDLVLADRDAVRLLRDCGGSRRLVLRNCPAYIRVWTAAQDHD